MSSKQNSSDRSTGNGANTALYITGIQGKQAEEDLKALAEICARPNNSLILCASPELQNPSLEELVRNGRIRICAGGETGDDVKNILPLQLPLNNEPDLICKWVVNAGKAYNGSNMVAALGRPSPKVSYWEKYLGYWANFWPKLFTGANSNLASCEAVLLNPADFRNLVVKHGIRDAWQLAASGEKEGICTKVPFEYKTGDFVFGDGIRAFGKGVFQGLNSLWLSFFRLAKPGVAISDLSDINHGAYKRAFGITALLLLLTMCFISFDYNITWDEPNHNTFSKDVLKYYSSFGSDTTMFDFQKAGHRDYFTNVYYGMSIDVFAAAVNSLTGAENEYATRHFINAIVGFFCILFAALTVRVFSGWLPALIALLALLCSPSFFGHCFNNPKDIPFAAGYIMALYYLMKFMKELPNARHQTKIMLAIAIGFAISIRAGGLLLLGFLGLAAGIHWLLFRNRKAGLFSGMKPYLFAFLLVGIAAYLIGIAMWPYALRQPLTGAIKALQEFEKFSYLTYYELFEGQRLFAKPWYYEPKLIMITAPLAILGGFVLSLLLAWFRKTKLQAGMLFVLITATLFPAAYAIYKESYVYNGWRHFIFIYPSMAALSILGWHWLAGLIRNKKSQLIIMALAGLSFIKPGLWSIANHP